MNTSQAHMIYEPERQIYQCIGSWSTLGMGAFNNPLKNSPQPSKQALYINGAQLTHFDSAGALVLIQCINLLKQKHNTITLTNFSEKQRALIELIEKNHAAIDFKKPKEEKKSPLYMLGQEAVDKFNQVHGFVRLIGDLTEKIAAALKQWRRFQAPSIISNLNSAGIQALPILALLSFLIGVVLAYQMGLQLETYGANTFIAYLSGMAIFREFAPLITAIIVAGRTSSAFTAQIGSMKINQEIDALLTMGLSPTELLVLPKVLALLIVFPLLIFWSDIFGTLGASLMSKSMLQVGYSDFMNRLQETVGLKQLMLGLYKAPTFALLIALVGCFQGFRVQNSADSVGHQTTKSVVQALFLIIVADATYSVIYSWMSL